MRDNKFLCDEEILNWLNERNLSGIIKGINENEGIINEKIASVIYCKGFISRFIDDYNYILNNYGFRISRITNDHVYISYIESDIEFSLESKEFMRKYSNILFYN